MQIRYNKSDFITKSLKWAQATAQDSWPTHDGKQLDRSAFVTSSEVGRCARMIKFGKLLPNVGKQPNGNLERWGFAQRGHAVEAWIVDQLSGVPGAQVMLTGKDQRSVHEGDQSGTPDGMLIDTLGYHCLEFKSYDPRKNTSYLPDPVHLDQVIQNMDLMEYCYDKDIQGAFLFYINASDFEDSLEFYVPWDEVAKARAAQLQDKAAKITNAKEANELSAEGMHSGRGCCDLCAFTAHCSAMIQNTQERAKTYDELRTAAAGIFGQS